MAFYHDGTKPWCIILDFSISPDPTPRAPKENIMKKNDFTVMHPVPEHMISRKTICTILSHLTVRIE